ncbi:MAG TPA: polyphosphate polymerase domain-containing protein [Prolixibacteraceae bacterium]|nr:polyphosphate polymerase domain-containing protein [Bacteroidales bacterium]OQB80516.1 MAG: VTC domain protein [Bacteroidetes bacterium ADurb.Bin123]HNU77117.1 polyphosphate polymerase domain-containing protein [Prolixibacteraceae bacterium]HOC87404.1 polyphosphate polymerase domain-containing protein [Prolixibacteraceae bacterium]HOG96828.1 polyphosphate polymerase domain-containing protein [Prolixibacteraceae bacterium]
MEKLSNKGITASDAGNTTAFRMYDLVGALQQIHHISLDEMEGVRLMKRMDTKYILSESRIVQILGMVTDRYQVLEVAGSRIATYETVYYDDPALKFFLDHINGKLNRNKVRTRLYQESDVEFLEVKRKMNTSRTKKYRIRIDPEQTEFDDEALDLVNAYSSVSLSSLSPVFVNRFRRITLVNREKTERVTIDLDLRYADILNEREIIVPRLVIIEIKQNRFSNSVMGEVLRDLRIKKTGISKYCLGISLLYPDVKMNKYKRKIRIIEKVTKNGLLV